MVATDLAHHLFNSKWPTCERFVQKLIRMYRLHERGGDEDLMQTAALILWGSCRNGAENINCRYIVLHAFRAWRQARRGRPDRPDKVQRFVSLEAPLPGDDGASLRTVTPVRELSIRVDEVTYTVADARIDRPELFGRADGAADWLSSSDVARRLGITHTRANQIAGRLGAIRVGRRWMFPPTVNRADYDRQIAEAAELRRARGRTGRKTRRSRAARPQGPEPASISAGADGDRLIGMPAGRSGLAAAVG